jgi:hypothetical protein
MFFTSPYDGDDDDYDNNTFNSFIKELAKSSGQQKSSSERTEEKINEQKTQTYEHKLTGIIMIT